MSRWVYLRGTWVGVAVWSALASALSLAAVSGLLVHESLQPSVPTLLDSGYANLWIVIPKSGTPTVQVSGHYSRLPARGPQDRLYTLSLNRISSPEFRLSIGRPIRRIRVDMRVQGEALSYTDSWGLNVYGPEAAAWIESQGEPLREALKNAGVTSADLRRAGTGQLGLESRTAAACHLAALAFGVSTSVLLLSIAAIFVEARRRNRRIRLGLCAMCRQPRVGDDRCTECGWAPSQR